MKNKSVFKKIMYAILFFIVFGFLANIYSNYDERIHRFNQKIKNNINLNIEGFITSKALIERNSGKFYFKKTKSNLDSSSEIILIDRNRDTVLYLNENSGYFKYGFFSQVLVGDKFQIYTMINLIKIKRNDDLIVYHQFR